MKSLSRVRLFVTPWTVAYQASPSMGFSRQEYWSGLPFPSSGDFPDPGIELRSPALEADALTSEPPGKMVYIHLHNEISEYPSYFISRHLLMVTMLKPPVFSGPQTHRKFLSLHTLAHTTHSPRNVSGYLGGACWEDSHIWIESSILQRQISFDSSMWTP